MSMFLFGCTVGPDFNPPVVKTPETYRFGTGQGARAVNLKWWDLFNDPDLYTLVTMALENNRDIKIAVSRISEARSALGFTKADQYPALNIEAGATTGNFSGVRSDDTNTSLFAAPVLSWEIDFWGKFRRATESAQADLLASEFALKTVQLSLIAEVAATYYLLLDYHQRLAISKNTLASRRSSLDIIQQRFDYGITPEIDVNQAQIQMEIAAAAIPQYERLIALNENALSTLLGQLPMEISTGKSLNSQTVPPEIPTGLPSALLKRRPDVAEAEAFIEARNAQIGVAEALRYPAISLTGLVGAASSELSSVTSKGGIWSAGAGLFGPIYDFGKNISRVEIERERTKQALYTYENTVLTAFKEVEDALVEIETYRNQVASVSRQQVAAKNANDLARERYDQGVTSYLEFLDAERSLFSVELELSELRQLYLRAYVKLYKALGGGWLTKAETETSVP